MSYKLTESGGIYLQVLDLLEEAEQLTTDQFVEKVLLEACCYTEIGPEYTGPYVKQGYIKEIK